eukprot:gene16313-19402_t
MSKQLISKVLLPSLRSSSRCAATRVNNNVVIGGAVVSSKQINKKSTFSNNDTSCVLNNNQRSMMMFACNSVGVRAYSSASAPGAIQFKLADIGEGIAECEVLNWYYKVGDSIKEFDKLCEVQSDKATVEITSRYDGVLTKLYYKVGDMAQVGTPLCDIVLEGSAAPEAAAPAAAPAAAAAPTAACNKAAGGEYNLNEITDTQGRTLKVLATPAVRHLAKSNSVDLNQVAGNGKDGRVMKEDILAFMNGGAKKQPVQQQQQQQSTPAVQQQAAPTTPATTTSTSDKPRETRIPISGIKKVMVKTMNAAALVPHFGYCDEYIMDGLMTLRSQLKPVAESRGIKLSYLPFIIKATSLALLRYPSLNASISPNESEVIIKNYHNIGVAMDTASGLLVPNIKNVESKSIFEIAQELNRLQKVGMAGQLSPADMTGGTFSLSNIGSIGGTYASPVLLLPEVAIGAIGKIQKLPRYDKNNNVYPVNLIQISWSADHRVIDGATMANFSNLLKAYMETPNTMLLDTK